MDNEKVKLDLIQFYSLEDIKIGTAFYLDIYDLNSNNVLKNILKIIKECMITKYRLSAYTENSLLFFFSSEYGFRKEHKNSFDLVASIFQNKTVCEYNNLEVAFGLRYLIYSFIWIYQMRKRGLSLKEKTYIIPRLIEATKLINKFKKYNYHFSGLIDFCDAHPVDSILVQYFNNKNLITATLQHGSYSSLYPDVLLASNSQFLLCYGNFTVNECLKVGMNKKKLIPLGMPQLINKEIKKEVNLNDSKIIGLIFDGYTLIKNDIKMLSIIDEYASKYGYKIRIKLHPGTGKDEYCFQNYKNIDNIHYDDISLKKFIDISNFIVCSISTVFIECLIEMKPVYLFKHPQMDVYYNVQWCKFQTLLELEKIVNYYSKDLTELKNKMLSTREYFTITTKVSEKYKSFFDEIIKCVNE